MIRQDSYRLEVRRKAISTRSRILGFGATTLLVLAGIAGAVGFGGTFGQVLALVLIGLGCVLATGLVFLEVGLSEDRERARESGQEPSAPVPSSPPPEAPRLHDRPARQRLGRVRGTRRRLG